jgi:hypothetical protein
MAFTQPDINKLSRINLLCVFNKFIFCKSHNQTHLKSSGVSISNEASGMAKLIIF